LRRIPLSHRSHVIGFQALPTGVAEHESALERDFVAISSFADADAIITGQPATLWFEFEGRPRRYTPDYKVVWGDGHVDIVEIKYWADLRSGWERFRPAFVAARNWAAANGARFRIVTERGIRGPRLDAAKRLLPLRNTPLDIELAEHALAAARCGERTFAELVAAVPAPRAAALAVVWRLIARNALYVDLSIPIVATTLVRAP
jgi:hypothetical protein